MVAPATANLLAKAAHGIADDFLTTLLLAARAPVLMVPGDGRRHVGAPGGGRQRGHACAGRGVTVLEPDIGALASGLSGKGRFPEIDDDRRGAAPRCWCRVRDLAGERVLVTAGPTREPIDPVRYISNRSSGQDGLRARDGRAPRGARGHAGLRPDRAHAAARARCSSRCRRPRRCARRCSTTSTRATIVVKAAAVADYRARQAASTKIKGKHDLTLELTPNPDILAEVAARRTGAFVVGFAAETHDVAANARAKLEAQGDRPAGGERREPVGHRLRRRRQRGAAARPLGRRAAPAAHAEDRRRRRDPLPRPRPPRRRATRKTLA